MENINLSIDDTDFYKGTSYRVAGVWNSTTEYVNDAARIDVVSHNGNSYSALQTNTNVEPGTDDSVWLLMAKAGDAGTIRIGTVTTVNPGQAAKVTNVGDNHNAVFNFEIPKGEAGETEIINIDELENYVYYGVKRRITQNSSSAWERIGNSNRFYFHSFAKEQPDLNWENAALRDEICTMMNYWQDKGVAGFRVDAIGNLKKSDQALSRTRFAGFPCRQNGHPAK